MPIDIDPKVDYAFKWVFGSERAREILIHLLNAILELPPGEQIVEIEILNPFTEKMRWDDKLSILDIKARDQLGRQFNVEMQMVAPLGLKQRVLYYWGKMYTEQLGEGQEYYELKRTISVCFVDGTVLPRVEEYHSTFRLIDIENGAILSDDLTIHFFELPKFKLTAEEVRTPLEAWLYFLRYAERLDPDNLPEEIATPGVRQAMERLMQLTKIDMQKEIYEGRLKAQRDARALTTTLAKTQSERAQAQNEQVQAVARAEEAEAWAAAEAEARVAAEAEARAAAEALERGVVVGRIQAFEKLLRVETPRADLEAMTLESLTELASQLERELSR